MRHVSSAGSAWEAASLRWIVPVAIAAIGVSYQVLIGAGFESPGSEHLVDLVLFGLVIPALASWGWTVRARAQQAEHLLAAFDLTLADPYVRLDPHGRVERWSRPAKVLLGYSSRDAHGRRLGELLGPEGDAAWLRLRDGVCRSGLVRGQQAVLRRANGQEVRVELSAGPVLDDAARFQGLLVILRDISRRSERTELTAQLNRGLSEKVEQLARANAGLEQGNRSQADLLSLALHEVRAPLAGIAGATERIESSCHSPTHTCARMLGVVRGQVARIEGFAGQMLKAAQIEAGSLVLEREATTVAAIVEQVKQGFCASHPTRRLQVDISPDLSPVYADRDCLAQVLCNLLGNADKYSPAEAVIEIAAREEGRQVRVSVRDHGPGLSAEALERAFDKFYRAHTPETRAACGHGLGLYISRQLMLSHGGEIRADNHPEGGAVFSFTIPTFS